MRKRILMVKEANEIPEWIEQRLEMLGRAQVVLCKEDTG